MSEVIFNENGVISMGSIDGEEDLKLRPGDNINPPPSDGRCDCCGRHISELKPYGKAGDPLVGDFNGALLVKGFRGAGPYDEEAELAISEAERCYETDGFDDPLEWMIDKFGKKKAEGFCFTSEAYHCVGPSWECRDCMCLGDNEYFEKLDESWGSRKTSVEENSSTPEEPA